MGCIEANNLIVTIFLVICNCEGYIGLTTPSPREEALDKYIEERHPSGFLAPTYTLDGTESREKPNSDETSQSKMWLQDFVGREAFLEQVKLKIERYNDATFKFWCYDTPGVLNPNQVRQNALFDRAALHSAGAVQIQLSATCFSYPSKSIQCNTAQRMCEWTLTNSPNTT